MKKFLRGFCAWFLKLALVGAATAAALVSVFASPGALKDSLAENNIYDGLVQNVLDSAKKNNEEFSGTNSETEQTAPPEKQRATDALGVAAGQAFTPQVLQLSVEQGLDGIYRWLNGEVDVPDFQIDLTQAKANFIAAAGGEVEKYAAGLPLCTSQQTRQFDPNADPFSLTCRPANLSPAAIRDKATGELSSSDFLKEPVITAHNLGRDENGQTFFERAEGAQEAYKFAKVLPWVLVILSLLLGGGVVLLSDTKRAGLKRVGISVLASGAFLLLSTWLFSFLLDRAARPGGMLGNSVNNDFRESILALTRSLNSLFNKTMLIYCIAYIIVGGATLLALHFTKPKELARTK